MVMPEKGTNKFQEKNFSLNQDFNFQFGVKVCINVVNSIKSKNLGWNIHQKLNHATYNKRNESITADFKCMKKHVESKSSFS